MSDPEARLREIHQVCGDQIAGASVSVHVPSMLGIQFNGQHLGRHVNLVGLDPATYNEVSEFGKFLKHPANREQVSFDLREDGYGPDHEGFPQSGWGYRKARVEYDRAIAAEQARIRAITHPNEQPESTFSEGPSMPTVFSPELSGEAKAKEFDPANEQYPGIILGISTCTTRFRDPENNVRDLYYCRPGDDVQLIFPNASDNTKVVHQAFTVVDLYESGMSEYDSTFAFVPLDKLQEYRGMIDPQSGKRSVTTIQLKLVEGADLNAVRDELRRRYPPDLYAYNIQTWRDMQGPLLAAVRLETTILNILLFLIIAVAGFGILSTFFMIVVEKTRDIGTLKALGASGGGVMSIFLSYGLLLGCVGSGVGMVGGLLFVANINSIAHLIERITGQEVFDPTVYYFSEIPTIVHPFTLTWVMAGAVAIAAMASVLPALRAARMHPVRALRFE
jgi:lipoprotein-releasing system permease protein